MMPDVREVMERAASPVMAGRRSEDGMFRAGRFFTDVGVPVQDPAPERRARSSARKVRTMLST